MSGIRRSSSSKGRMKITFKCHQKGCKKKINENLARLVGVNWYYCEDHAREHGGV